MDRVHHVQPVNGNDAINMAQKLARKEGIFTGISGGGAVAGAIGFLENLSSSGKKVDGVEGRPLNVCAIAADTGERYLSTLLFENVPVDMSQEEIEICNSTPLGQFSAPSLPSSSNNAAADDDEMDVSFRSEELPVYDLDPKAEIFVKDTLANNKVVMFSLEWCEFCHTVKKFFHAAGIDFFRMPLDSARNKKDNWGIKVRRVISSMTGCMTIPQFFIGGEFIGGAMDVVKGFRDGSLKPKLVQLGVSYRDGIDPEIYLPNWISKSGGDGSS